MTPNELSEKIKDWEYVKDKIFFALEPRSRVEEVKAKTNNDEYVTVPMGSEQICLVYKIKIDEPVAGIPAKPDTDLMDTVVKASWLKNWEGGEGVEDLFGLAIKNMETMFPAEIDKLPNFLNQIVPGTCTGPTPADDVMLVVTNKTHICGAATIFLPDSDAKIKEMLGCDEYWLLPSSRHELLAVAANINVDLELLEQMVKEVNLTVDPRDILGEEVLKYDATRQKLEPANAHSRGERDDEKVR